MGGTKTVTVTTTEIVTVNSPSTLPDPAVTDPEAEEESVPENLPLPTPEGDEEVVEDPQADAKAKQALAVSYAAAKAETVDQEDSLYPGPGSVKNAIMLSEPQIKLSDTLLDKAEITELIPAKGETAVVGDATGGEDLCLVGRSESGALFDLQANQNGDPGKVVSLVAKADEEVNGDSICDWVKE